MKVFGAFLFAGLLLGTTARACDNPDIIDEPVYFRLITAGVPEAEARAAQDAAWIAERDESLRAARAVFLGRYGRALGFAPTLVKASETARSDANATPSAYAQNP